MLSRAERLPLGESCLVPVLQIEDLIGLKVQAATNDPARAPGDWSDIFRLVIHAADSGRPLEWGLVADYLAIFGCDPRLTELKALYERHLGSRETATAAAEPRPRAVPAASRRSGAADEPVPSPSGAVGASFSPSASLLSGRGQTLEAVSLGAALGGRVVRC